MKRERDLLRDKAIHLTLRAYDILPVDESGKTIDPRGKILVPGRFAGKQAHWIPVAGENKERPTHDAKGSRYTIPRAVDPFTGREPIAYTPFDGVSVLFPGEPFRSPTDLALTLYHEKVHFDQFITPGVGDKLTFSEREVKAWTAEMNAVDSLGLSPAETKARKDAASEAIARYRDRIDREKWLRKITLGAYASKEPEYLDPRSNGEIEEIAKRSDELDAIVAEELQQVRRERDAREAAQKKAEAERSEREIQENMARQSLGPLWRASDNICRRGWADKTSLYGIPISSNREFYCDNGPRIMNAEDSCQTRLYGMILGQLCRSGEFDPAPVIETLREFQGFRRGPPPVMEADGRPFPPAVEASSPPGALSSLEKLAAKACAEPAGLVPGDVAGFSWFPDRNLGPMIEAAERLRGCEGEIMAGLGRLNMTATSGSGINLEWLRGLVASHSTPAPDPDSDARPEREGGRGGNRVGDGSSPARDQAGRIGRGGNWPR